MPAMLVATWKPAFPAVERLAPLLASRAISPADAVEQVCIHVEDDPNDHSVGYGGHPNANGVMELDGAFMDGATYDIGAVCGLVGFAHPVSVARAVMEKTPHNLLVGQGAMDFAREHGFAERDNLTPEEQELYLAWKAKQAGKPPAHDTVCAIALAADGHIMIGCSTSGLAYKLPGRASDTCVPGAGFFCDDRVGGAVATGRGEEIMKGCLSRVAFDLMAQGASPERAAREAIARLKARYTISGEVAVLCLDKFGRFGGAANHDFFAASVGGEGFAPRVVTYPVRV